MEKGIVRGAALLGMFIVAVAAARAESEPEDIIKYRQKVMESSGAHMSASAAILQGKVPYKKDLVEHARALQAMNRDVAALFPKDSDFGDTKALDAVWKKKGDFEKRAKEAAAKAASFARAAAGSDSKAQLAAFKELSDACKACHKDFRKEPR